ncbi:MAG: DUF4105 domain-containing protein [Tannerella sp.]|jgi:hypothetical protein|nr:DUF4105 domain-containing protein [Tannerella sp.]
MVHNNKLPYILALLFLLSGIKSKAEDIQIPQLSLRAQISLLTCSPDNGQLYTVYGHTAIRVVDPEIYMDAVFNYGIFDFTKPNFLYRFAKGETDYKLAVFRFDYFFDDYKERGSEIYEQVLNLQPDELNSLWKELVINMQPENCVYRYNFFFDNCATRPAVIIERNINGKVRFDAKQQFATFRDVINYCTRDHPWSTFGCDLVLGLPTDRVMSPKESFFIPECLKNAFDKAEIIRDGETSPLVLKSNILSEKTLLPEPPQPFATSPLACSILFFTVILLITLMEWRKKTYFRPIDIILFSIAGIAGCIVFFLSFLSVHPGTFPNISIFWLHPFHLAGIIFLLVKKFNKVAFWYHFINFAVVFVMSAAWFFIPQHFNIAFIPLIASLWLRSGTAILRRKFYVE